MYVIRSMSTTDSVLGSKSEPYHIYLLPPEKRTSAYWCRTTFGAMLFDTIEEAEEEWLAHWAPDYMGVMDIAPLDCKIPVWERKFHTPEMEILEELEEDEQEAQLVDDLLGDEI